VSDILSIALAVGALLGAACTDWQDDDLSKEAIFETTAATMIAATCPMGLDGVSIELRENGASFALEFLTDASDANNVGDVEELRRRVTWLAREYHWLARDYPVSWHGLGSESLLVPTATPLPPLNITVKDILDGGEVVFTPIDPRATQTLARVLRVHQARLKRRECPSVRNGRPERDGRGP